MHNGFWLSSIRGAVLFLFGMVLLCVSGCGGDDDKKESAGSTVDLDNVVVTDSYKVEYLPAVLEATQGKSEFQIRLTNIGNGQAVTGAKISLNPVMDMPSKTHATPVDGCFESDSAGIYDCTVYYLMPSKKGDIELGKWRVEVTIDAGHEKEQAVFYPLVKMAGSDTVRVRLKGIEDKIAGITVPESRSYFLFYSELSGSADNHYFQIFVAAKESMMSYPALTSNALFNAADIDYELQISSVEIEFSTDAEFWQSANDDGNGYWSVNDLDGLSAGSEGRVYVRLSVNGEQKTTNGKSPSGDGSNDYATFIVTPPVNAE